VANIKSQIKRNRQNNKRRLRNRVDRGAARSAVKDARTAIDAGIPESKAALLQAIRLLDKAAEKGVIHRNNAARRKSRLVKAFTKMVPTKLEGEPTTVEPVAEEPKKAAPRRRAAKVEEPKVQEATEPKKAAAPKKEAEPKKAAVKKTAAKKPATTPRKTTAKKK
jgi:small subunit ribosomal protein S20